MSNRIIKFRAWDRVNQVLTGGFTLTDCSDGYVDSEGIKLNECDVMQFTGLFDENGTEIYEGDILNHDNKHFEGGINVIVQWSGAGFYAGYGPHIPIPEILKMEAEIIGNIYENPELIK